MQINNKRIKTVLTAMLLIQLTLQPVAHASSAFMDSKNKALVQAQIDEAKYSVDSSSVDCADPTAEGSLAGEQKRVIDERKGIFMKSIDLGRAFEIGKKEGCFAALSDFPDLSATIPSLSAIFDSLKQTLIKYAVRKVCTAVNDVIEDAISPLKEAIDDLSESGQLDLSGRVNTKITKELYDVDPELGRISRPAQSGQNIDFTW